MSIESQLSIFKTYSSVRKILGERNIVPEALPPEEDIKKVERRMKSEEKKLGESAGHLPEAGVEYVED